MPAPVEIVEADHRQVARHRKSAALGFQQHAIGDDVVAADDGRRPVLEARADSAPPRAHRPAYRAPRHAIAKASRCRASASARRKPATRALARSLLRWSAETIPIRRWPSSIDMRGGAIGGGFIVGADARIGTVGPIDADIDEGHRVVGEHLAQGVVMAVAAQHQTIDAAADRDCAPAPVRRRDRSRSWSGTACSRPRRDIFAARRCRARTWCCRWSARSRRACASGATTGCGPAHAGCSRPPRSPAQMRARKRRAHRFGIVERARDRCRRHAGPRRDGANALFADDLMAAGSWLHECNVT